MVIIFSIYNLNIFVWIQRSCLTNIDSALNPSSSVIKRIGVLVWFVFMLNRVVHLVLNFFSEGSLNETPTYVSK